MRDNEKYKAMVVSFRMSELQTLMVYAGKSKAGKKSDLQVGVLIPELTFNLCKITHHINIETVKIMPE